MNLAVVVPTYQRPEQLRLCLTALLPQLREDDELVVVYRPTDHESSRVVADFPAARATLVHEPGVVQAMEAGARSTSAELLAFTDDDAVSSPTWLEQIRAPFMDEAVGAVGGRDRVWSKGVALEPSEDLPVGTVSRWGGQRGNHHLGSGAARRADVVKGVNMAWRRSAIAFPQGLAGRGAQPHYEIAMCAWARRHSYSIVYDPAILVDQYPGERFDEDGRAHRSTGAVRDEAYNLALATSAWGHTSRLRVAVRGAVIGNAATPGVARWLAGRLSLARRADGLLPSLIGRLRAAVAPGISFRPLVDLPEVLLLAHDIHDRGGGMERCLLEQIGRLRNNFRFRVVSMTMDPALPGVEHVPMRAPRTPFIMRFGIYFLFAPTRGRAPASRCTVAVGALSRRRADVVLLHYLHSGYSGPRGNRVSGSELGVRRVYAATLHRLFLFLERRQFVGWSPVLAAVSEGLAEEVQSSFPGAAVRVVPNGIDDDFFHPPTEAAASLRGRLGIPPDAHVAAFVGGDWQRKGLASCLEAVSFLERREGLGVHLVVAGVGDTHSFGALAAAQGVAAQVHFLGLLDTSAGLYAMADSLLIPSGYETFSLVAHEAAAAGVPVIGTDVHGIRDIIAAGGGVLVDRESTSIADALRALALNPELGVAMGEAGRAYVRRFTWDRSAQLLGAVLQNVIERNNRRPDGARHLP